MTKQEATLVIKKKINEGYLTHSILLDLYEEDEDIPFKEEEECILWYKPTPPQPIVIYIGLEGAKQWDKIWEDSLKQFKENGIH